MIKKNFLIFSLLMLTNPITVKAGHCQAIHEEIDNGMYYQEESSLHATLQKYVASIVPGTIVGINMGVLCAIFDHMLPPLWPVFWFGSYYQRTRMVNSISDEYNRRHVRHDKVLMELCALISTWLSYYKAYEVVHGNPPF